MNKFKHFFLLVVFSLFLVLLISCGGNSPTKYTITWKNGDVTVKTLDNIENIDEAKFDGTAPIKAKTQEYTYTFDGWEKTVNEDTKEVTYTAKFTSVKNKYNVTFVDEDGTTVLKEAKAYDYGTLASQIEKPEDPTKEPTNSIVYTFAGWDKEVSTVTEDVIYKAKYTSGTRKYNVKFMDDDGTTVLKEAKAYDYGTPAAEVQAPANPTKEATAEYTYEFTGWDRQILDVTSDITYTAVYRATKNKYNVVWKNYDGTVLETDENVEYGIMPTFDGATPAKPADANYRYMHEGWTPIVSTVSGNIEYQATFTEIPYSYYSITFNSNGGTNVESQSIRDGLTATEPKAPEKTGYSFDGWYYIDENQQEVKWDFKYAVLNDVELKAKWNINSYTLSIVCESKKGTATGGGTYEYNSDVTIEVTPKAGYRFLGIYKSGSIVSNQTKYEFKMGASNVTYSVIFELDSFTIEIDNQTEGITVSGITSGEKYPYSAELTLIATNIPEGYSVVWTRSDKVTETCSSYKFSVPAKDLVITVTKILPSTQYTRESNKIYFGSYPQKLVADEDKIAALNTKAGTLPTEEEFGSWKDYRYYLVGYPASYMFYQDIDENNDGSYDYRGVYFIKERPEKYTDGGTSTGNQSKNNYVINTVYWFEYNPIEWIVLKEENGKAMLLANLVLDSQEVYNDYFLRKVNHNGGYGYPNNYELSTIRLWLNNTFYETAFNSLQQAIIDKTLVDNNTDNVYKSNNTVDKMFLLSETELKSDYVLDDYVMAFATDYAKCQGVIINNRGQKYSAWWLRTPCSNNGIGVSTVYGDKTVYYPDCYYSSRGVRPCCWIIL